MPRHLSLLLASSTLLCLALLLTPGPGAELTAAPSLPHARVVGWNNLGMHCMDKDFSVFSLLPPFNVFHAQLVVNGQLVTSSAGYTVTYEAVADPAGSINTTSVGKTNFWTWVDALYGLNPAPDTGLLGVAMPGAGNTPRPMTFQGAEDWWIAEGLPIVPKDDANQFNPYPMMRITARDGSMNVLARTDIVLPVSTEMTCTACHASGTVAQPAAGWANDADPERDYRLNVLRLHDETEGGRPEFTAALASKGYNAAGLYASVVNDANPVLCADCHLSNALSDYGFTGIGGVRPLTQAMHGRHASVADPSTGIVLNAGSRDACYLCHPGSTTKCLRGAMGKAIAADGTPEMQCQSCHGTMSAVGQAGRPGWLDEPACQDCHTGTATVNSGQIRYTSVFTSPGVRRVAADTTFATSPDTPAPGISLFRFSRGHGGLACQACHGSTHAEYPAMAGANDNETTIQLQGHEGMLVECGICHQDVSTLAYGGGPHGMHTAGQDWVDRHHHLIEAGTISRTSCQACHGTDYRGTVLSRSQADRTLNGEDFGTKNVWRGQTINCYTCHDGPGGEGRPRNPPPLAANAMAATLPDTPIDVTLAATGTGALTYRIVSQPAHGAVALAGRLATFNPDAGFLGADVFTFAASNDFGDSNLATVYLTVKTGPIPPPVIEPVDLAVRWLSLTFSRGKFSGTLEVVNSGTAPSPKTTVTYLLSTDQIADPGDLALKPGKVKAFKVGASKVLKFKAKLPAGTTTTGKYFIAIVNSDAAFGETTMENNTAVYGPLP